MPTQIMSSEQVLVDVGSGNALIIDSLQDGNAAFSYVYTSGKVTQIIRWTAAGSQVRDRVYDGNYLAYAGSWY